jgi:uncharacterized protein YecE (DUF72 family)
MPAAKDPEIDARLETMAERDAAARVTPRRVFVGTSGFAYPAWKPSFYPRDLPAKKFLSYYAQHFRTTEINNTFYRFPRVSVTEAWSAQVPAGFSFTLKLSQRVTHAHRLRDVDREMGWFLDGALALQEKLGAILVQLPPNLRKDVPLLESFTARHASHARLAFEFRHASWFADEVYDILRRHDCGLAVVEVEDGDELPLVREATGSLVYMRLRKGAYGADELAGWAHWIGAQRADVYCYFKHEDQGPALARRLLAALGDT